MGYFITFLFYALLMLCVPSIFNKSIKNKGIGKISYYYFGLFLALGILSLVACFRGNTGTDTLMYVNAYKTQNFIRTYDHFEFGFILLCRLLFALGLPYQTMLFFMCFLQSLFVFKAIEHEKAVVHVRLAIYIYIATLYLNSFNIMRQSLAVGICFYAMIVYMDGKYIQSIIWILLAMQFHEKSFIVLGIIVAKLVFDRSSRVFMAIVFALVVYLVYHREFLNEMYKFIFGYYTGYLSNDVETHGNIYSYLVKMSPIILLMFLGFRDYLENKKYRTFMGVTIVGISFGMLEYFTNTQVGRIGEFLSCLEIVVLPYIACKGVKINKIRFFSPRLTRYFIYAYFFVIFIYNYAYRNFGELFPYGGFV